MKLPSQYTLWLVLPRRPKGTSTEAGASLVMYLLGGFPNPWRATFKIGGAIFLQFPFEFHIRKRPLRSISRAADFGGIVAIPRRG